MDLKGTGLERTKLLYQTQVDRKPLMRRFRFSFMLAIITGITYFALELASGQVNVDTPIMEGGKLAAILVTILLGLRALVSLVRARMRKPETLRFFNKGFGRMRGDKKQQYSWGKLRSYREDIHGIHLGKRRLVQWGKLTLTMSDKQVMEIKPVHGDLRRFAKVIRPYAAEVTGTMMARRLREEKPTKLHPKLIVWPGGMEVGKEEIPWENVSLKIAKGRLLIRTKEGGKVRVVKRFPVGSVENVGGLLEVASITSSTHRGPHYGE